MRTVKSWTPDKIERLRKLATSGLTGRQIADALGHRSRGPIFRQLRYLNISIDNGQGRPRRVR